MEDFIQTRIEDTLVIKFSFSRATVREAETFRQILNFRVSQNFLKIIIDLSECDFIDSTILGVLVLSLKTISQKSGEIRLVISAYTLNLMLEKSGAMKIFNVYRTVEEAVESFRFELINS